MKTQKYTDRKSAVTALLLAVIFIAISALTGSANSPAKQFIAAAKKSTVGMLSGILPKLLAAYTKPASSFSTNIDVSVEKIKFSNSSYDADVINILKELELNLKADIKPDNLLIYAGLNYDGDDILTGTLTQDKNGIGFYLPELTDGDYYVISNLDEFLQELDYYSDDEEEDIEFEPIKNFGKAASKCLKRYFAFTTACVTDDNVEMEENEDIKLNLLHKKVDNCKVHIFQPDSDDLKTLFENIPDELEADEELAEFFFDFVSCTFIAEPPATPSPALTPTPASTPVQLRNPHPRPLRIPHPCRYRNPRLCRLSSPPMRLCLFGKRPKQK